MKNSDSRSKNSGSGVSGNGKKGGDRLQGQVERVTYHNEENGYSVLQMKVAGRRGLVTVVGNFMAVTPGEALRLQGEWSTHPQYGEQFKSEHYETLEPATVDGIRKYLGSGLIKGIGPVMAKRIVQKFGEVTLNVIDADIEQLQEIEGIGPYRIGQIKKAWEDQKEIREVMLFLRSHEVSAAYATKIFKHYGRDSLRVLQENPYRLAMDIHGIGFLTADRIAQRLGFAPDSPLRAEAGILYILFKASEAGHVCLPRSELIEQCTDSLEIPRNVLEDSLPRLNMDGRIVIQPLPESSHAVFEDAAAVYLRGHHQAETRVAQRLIQRNLLSPLKPPADLEQAASWLRERLPFELAPLQEEAVKKTLVDNLVIITGGPGTGKTTLIQAVLALYKRMRARACLAAPTGRAAKRLSEATRHPASTLHRLLEFSPQGGGFQRNERNPLSADLIIVDEASMIDSLMMHHLMKAVPNQATLVLVGDVDQLPSVGPGSVLHDMIESGLFSVVRLTKIFRQAKKSQIVVNAHKIQQGQFPYLSSASDRLQDFYFIEKDEAEEVLGVILRVCRERIPKRFNLDPVEDVQVLTPMNRGIIGTQRLNSELQNAFSPGGASVERGGRVFRLNDKVMQIKNNYDKDVFNGDIGRICKIDLENQELHVRIDGRPVPYDFSEMDELVLAYAVTVHKSQGSEYPAVVVPLLTQHYMMLQRNLLYTAITRGKKLVVLVGSKKALAIAVNNNKPRKRFTLLTERLQGQVPKM